MLKRFLVVATAATAISIITSGVSSAEDRFPPRDMAVHAHKVKHHQAKRHHKARRKAVQRHHVRGRSYRAVRPRRDPARAVGDFLAVPARFIAGRLACARNVNAALAARGIRGTGSALAKSFLRWGRASGPVPGAVAVYNRRGGGHVAIVAKVVNGKPWVWNPGRRGWRLVAYPRQAIAYRVAG